MASSTLYTYPENFRSYKILIAAQYSGAKLESPAFKFGETNKSDDFLKKFPLGKVPALETSDGTAIFESNAIARYVGGEKLHGKTPTEQALVEQWISFADCEIVPSSCTWVFPCLGIIQFNKQNTERAKQDIQKALGVLNTVLKTKTYLVGERITQADVTVACALLQLYQHVLEPGFRAPYQNTNRWFTTMINQPQFKTVIGSFKFCEKMAQFDAKKFAEVSGKGKKEEKKPNKKPKETAPKTEAEAPKKEVNLLAEYIKSVPASKTFVMDDWKKKYCNEDNVMDWFFDNIDEESYSVWYGTYNYNSELTQPFMSMNLIGGMFQRLEKMRKYAMGVHCLFGENKDSAISGVWVWRGKKLIFGVDPDLNTDAESYTWRKMDLSSAEDRRIITEHFNMDEKSTEKGGRKFNDATHYV
ncbi:elongation factor 1-gamma-like [Tubulanus polymorphus]|uniref:elongation factor 1-gamma-like n=1 Tax=Tubulanus polymorphus TaxID=672921 RepID=UPI003DA44462